MSDKAATAVPALVLSRVYDTTPERLFEAWTDPHALAKFLGPGNVKAIDIKTDPRVGGSYSLVMVLENGERLPVGGVYREVQRPSRLSMTWRWQEDRPEDEIDTLLTLEFIVRGGKTELVLTHEQLASVESRANHEEGWTAILDELARVL
jgi:uncharacterized protein YndB with AHSA1/START domain